MDGATIEVIASRLNITENAQSLLSFFHQLKEQGLDPTSATIDGNPSIKRALVKCMAINHYPTLFGAYTTARTQLVPYGS